MRDVDPVLLVLTALGGLAIGFALFAGRTKPNEDLKKPGALQPVSSSWPVLIGRPVGSGTLFAPDPVSASKPATEAEPAPAAPRPAPTPEAIPLLNNPDVGYVGDRILVRTDPYTRPTLADQSIFRR